MKNETMEDCWNKPVERFCGNCVNHIIGYKTADGLVKIQCPRCGMVSVMKKKSRRLVQVDEHAPPGQKLK